MRREHEGNVSPAPGAFAHVGLGSSSARMSTSASSAVPALPSTTAALRFKPRSLVSADAHKQGAKRLK